MPFYRYRAFDADGSVVKGQIEALHEVDLEAQLSRLNLSLVRATPIKGGAPLVKTLPRREIINLFFQLEMLVRSGVPILAALSDLRDSAESTDGRNIAGGLYEKIEAGSTLGEAIASYPNIFSDTIINLVRAGEISGQLAEVLQDIVRSLKWQDELSSQTKKLLMYPAFVTVVITGVVFFLMIYLVPQLVGFLKNMGQEVPLHTRMLIGLSNFLVNYWYVLLLTPPLAIAGITLLARSNPQVRYKLHELELAIPYIGPILKKLILARLADTFSLMYRTGISVLEGLKTCEQISGNLVVQQSVRRARERIATGAGISEGFAAENLFPPLVIRMLRVGETTGALDESLKNISYFYTRDIDESIGKVQAMIEPVMTVVLGLILGWIMMAVLGPIYDTISKIRT